MSGIISLNKKRYYAPQDSKVLGLFIIKIIKNTDFWGDEY